MAGNAAGTGGLIDESIKVLLPTREFDFVDLVKDWVGVAAAVGMIALKNRRAVE